MIAASQFRFEEEIENGFVDIHEMDLRIDYPKWNTRVTLAVLLLQFVPIEYRQQIVYQAFKHTVPGGAFIVVEKVLGGTHQLDQMMVASYLDTKAQNGYSREAIDRKRLSLEGVLVPVTAEMNEMFLRRAGFKQVDCFWRWMNFAGWVAVKE
jgi:tRNA (cmo5U34)-methyltransferase